MKKKLSMIIALVLIFTATSVITPSRRVDAKPSKKYVTHYNKAKKKANRYEKKANESFSTDKMNKYLKKAYKTWDKEMNYMYKRAKKKLSKSKFNKLKKSQRKWIKSRDKKADKAYNSEGGGSIATSLYYDSLISSTKKRTKWIMNKYL